MKRRNKRIAQKLNNKGFTLVEVLVAMIILSIVAIPILSGLVTSVRINAKARTTQQVTTVAESVMERFKGTDIETVADTDWSVAPWASVTKANVVDANYYFAIDNYDLGSAKYDVRVCATPVSHQSVDLVSTSVMNPYRDFVFTDDIDAVKGQYLAALNGLLDYINDHYNPVYNNGYGEYVRMYEYTVDTLNKSKVHLNRDINVTVTGDASSQHVDVSTTYSYKVSAYQIENPSTHSATTFNIPSTNLPATTLSKDYEALEKLYIFFFPAYSMGDEKVDEDRITVTNETGVDLDVYLIKQKNENLSAASLNTREVSYRPEITVGEHLTLYHNMHTNVSGLTDADPYPSFALGNAVLEDTANTNLMYRLTVDVYDADAYSLTGFTGTPIETFEGSMNSK